MTYVKQRLGQGEAPDTGSGRSRTGPGHLAGGCKGHPTHSPTPSPSGGHLALGGRLGARTLPASWGGSSLAL